MVPMTFSVWYYVQEIHKKCLIICPDVHCKNFTFTTAVWASIYKTFTFRGVCLTLSHLLIIISCQRSNCSVEKVNLKGQQFETCIAINLISFFLYLLVVKNNHKHHCPPGPHHPFKEFTEIISWSLRYRGNMFFHCDISKTKKHQSAFQHQTIIQNQSHGKVARSRV